MIDFWMFRMLEHALDRHWHPRELSKNACDLTSSMGFCFFAVMSMIARIRSSFWWTIAFGDQFEWPGRCNSKKKRSSSYLYYFSVSHRLRCALYRELVWQDRLQRYKRRCALPKTDSLTQRNFPNSSTHFLLIGSPHQVLQLHFNYRRINKKGPRKCARTAQHRYNATLKQIAFLIIQHLRFVLYILTSNPVCLCVISWAVRSSCWTRVLNRRTWLGSTHCKTVSKPHTSSKPVGHVNHASVSTTGASREIQTSRLFRSLNKHNACLPWS